MLLHATCPMRTRQSEGRFFKLNFNVWSCWSNLCPCISTRCCSSRDGKLWLLFVLKSIARSKATQATFICLVLRDILSCCQPAWMFDSYHSLDGCWIQKLFRSPKRMVYQYRICSYQHVIYMSLNYLVFVSWLMGFAWWFFKDATVSLKIFDGFTRSNWFRTCLAWLFSFLLSFTLV